MSERKGPAANPGPNEATTTKTSADASLAPELICWHEPGSHQVCPTSEGEHVYLIWGRCRSGQRWFWATQLINWRDDYPGDSGWADIEDEAVAAARASAIDLAAGRPAIAYPKHGRASQRLKEINAEKRRQRPSNGNTDAGPVEYLYGRNDLGCGWDGNWCPCEDLEGQAKRDYHIVRFPITKKTAKRIYYLRREGTEPEIGYVSRQELEANGEVRNRGVHWSSDGSHLYAEPPDIRPWEPDPRESKAELSRLRAEMADAHPDRGGTNAAFIDAHRRYRQACRGAAS